MSFQSEKSKSTLNELRKTTEELEKTFKGLYGRCNIPSPESDFWMPVEVENKREIIEGIVSIVLTTASDFTGDESYDESCESNIDPLPLHGGCRVTRNIPPQRRPPVSDIEKTRHFFESIGLKVPDEILAAHVPSSNSSNDAENLAKTIALLLREGHNLSDEFFESHMTSEKVLSRKASDVVENLEKTIALLVSEGYNLSDEFFESHKKSSISIRDQSVIPKETLDALKADGFHIPKNANFDKHTRSDPIIVSDVVTHQMNLNTDLAQKYKNRLISILGKDIVSNAQLANVIGDGKCGIYSVFAYLARIHSAFGKMKYADIMKRLKIIMEDKGMDLNPDTIDAYVLFPLVRELFEIYADIDINTYSFMIIPIQHTGDAAQFVHNIGTCPIAENTICMLLSGGHYYPLYFEKKYREQIYTQFLLPLYGSEEEYVLETVYFS